ncbi:MAG: hypothetical protein JW782_04000 [Candidatus Saganbacteria bacterium]|nr:hypothetical protein [Candidatus Saganbacteria bacterium]
MGLIYYARALRHPVPSNALAAKVIRTDLKRLGIDPGHGGIVTALSRLPANKYNGLLTFLQAVRRDVQMSFSLRLPALSIMLGNGELPGIDFAPLIDQVDQVVTEFFDYRSQTLDLRLLPAYLRRVRLSNGLPSRAE